MRKIEMVQHECQRLQDLLDDFLNFAKVRRFATRAGRSECPGQAGPRLLSPPGGGLAHRGGRLPDHRSAHGAAGPREFSRAPLNLLSQRPPGHAGGRPTRGADLRDGEGVALDLIDTGHGMDEHTAAQVFDAFFSTKSGGSGLGLPTRKIIEAHGGSIALQSQLGHGTR